VPCIVRVQESSPINIIHALQHAALKKINKMLDIVITSNLNKLLGLETTLLKNGFSSSLSRVKSTSLASTNSRLKLNISGRIFTSPPQTVRAAMNRLGDYYPIEITTVYCTTINDIILDFKKLLKEELEIKKLPKTVIDGVIFSIESNQGEIIKKEKQVIPILKADRVFWSKCQERWGKGSPYIKNIVSYIDQWFNEHQEVIQDDINNILNKLKVILSVVLRTPEIEINITPYPAPTNKTRIGVIVYAEDYKVSEKLPKKLNDIRLLTEKLELLEFSLSEYLVLSSNDSWNNIIEFIEANLPTSDNTIFLFCYSGHGALYNGAPVMIAENEDMISYEALYSVIRARHNNKNQLNAIIHDGCLGNIKEFRSPADVLPKFPKNSILLQGTSFNEIGFSGFLIPVIVETLRNGVGLAQILEESLKQVSIKYTESKDIIKDAIEKWNIKYPNNMLQLQEPQGTFATIIKGPIDDIII